MWPQEEPIAEEITPQPMTPAISSQEPGFAESIQDVGIRRRLHAPQSSEQAARRHASLQVPTEFKGQSQSSAQKRLRMSQGNCIS